jgi:hypothetical protein
MINRRLIAVAGAAAAVTMAAPAAEAAPRAVTVSPEKKTVAWDGLPGPGLNVTWFTDSLRPTGQCGADVNNFCDETLVHFDSDEDITPSTLKFRMEGFAQYSDFDLRVYESDESGEPLNYLGSPTSDNSQTSQLGSNDPRNTFIGDFESLEVADPLPDSYYLVRVVYFTVAPNESYKGSVTFTDSSDAE